MQDQKTTPSSAGSLKISQEVIASIAEYTVNEIEGVAGVAPMSSGITGWLLEKQTMRPISIVISEGVAVIDIRICIKSDVRIPELSQKLQAAVKESVQNMTGIVVSRVNLNIVGIVFPEPAQAL